VRAQPDVSTTRQFSARLTDLVAAWHDATPDQPARLAVSIVSEITVADGALMAIRPRPAWAPYFQELPEVGQLARTARASERLSQRQLLPYNLTLRQIRRIEVGDSRVRVADLWRYARFLGLRTSRLLPQERRPFDDLDERAADRTLRLEVLAQLRRRTLPHPKSLRELIRVRATGPLATDSELIEKEPVMEIEWPPAVVAAEHWIKQSLASRILNEMDALTRTLEAFLMADLELSQDVESFADPKSGWLHHPHNNEALGQALQQLAGHLQSYVAAAGALIDHARRFRRRYAAVGTPPGTECEKRVRATFSGAESVIIGCLRTYALHHSLPLVVGEPEEATAEGWSTVILVDTVSLLDGDFSAQEKSVLRNWPRGYQCLR